MRPFLALVLGALALPTSAAATIGAAELCNEIDDDCDGFIDEDFDLDGDGAYDSAACVGTGHTLDCDDVRPDVYAGAPEDACDGVDEDCDGLIDETFDADGDGAPSGADPDCAAAHGALADCDDADPQVHPDADESCNGLDDDCDGTVDAEFDGDGDGYWANSAACAATYGSDALDCDDTDADVYPTAPELCDGLDNDCDGAIPEDDDGDDWFDADLCAQGRDCDDTDPAIHPEAVEIADSGVDANCDGALTTSPAADPGCTCDGGTGRATVVFSLAVLGWRRRP